MVVSASISDWVVMVFHAGASSPMELEFIKKFIRQKRLTF